MIDWRSSGHEHGGVGSEEEELQREAVRDGQDRAPQDLIPDRLGAGQTAGRRRSDCRRVLIGNRFKAVVSGS